MHPVAVVTDSTAYLPDDVLAAQDIHTVPLSVLFADGTSSLETELSDRAAYWRRLADLEQLPTTSQPSVGAFTEVYEPLLAAGSDIVSVHLSGAISGTAESAELAAETMRARHPDRTIIVCDSRTAGGGLGLAALAATAAARSGEPASSVAARTEVACEALSTWFAVDTLEYLRRGGRVGAAQAWLGSALKIKPILTISGEITPIERVRTSRRAFERLLEFAAELRDKGSTAWIVQHIQADEQAARLAAAAGEIIGTEPVFVSELGPVIGTHVGPGLLGIGGLPPALLAS